MNLCGLIAGAAADFAVYGAGTIEATRAAGAMKLGREGDPSLRASRARREGPRAAKAVREASRGAQAVREKCP